MEKGTRFGIYKVVALFLMFLFAGSDLIAQEDVITDKERAFKHIVDLKNGALVVRLRVNTKKVTAYREAGYEDLAKSLEKKVQDKNKKMLDAFVKNFDFCPVYFIYSNDYDKLLSGERKGFFVNEDLEIDTSIKLTLLNFLFCDLGPAYYQAAIKQSNPELKMLTSTPAYQEGLVIKNHNLLQILDPFPAEVKILGGSLNNAVKRLNGNLYQMLGKTWGTKKKKKKKK